MRHSNALMIQREIAESGAPRTAPDRGFAVRLTSDELLGQAVALTECFPGMSTDFVDDNLRTWEKMGLPDMASDIRPVFRRDALGSDYGQAMERLMGALREVGIVPYSWGAEHYPFLRPEYNTVLKLHELERIQKGNIIFIPVDLTGRHTGAPALDARRYLAQNEFGLGAFEGGCWLLSNRHVLPSKGIRLMYIGDTYNPGPGSDRKSVPTYSNEEHEPMSKGKIFFSRRHVEEPDRDKHWLIPTGFVPQ